MSKSSSGLLISKFLKISKGVPASFRRKINLGADALYEYADVYDAVYKGQKGDRAFYVNEAKKGDVLYLGVGSGRIFRKVASTNPNAVGLDYSPKMTKNIFGLGKLKSRIIFSDVRKVKIKQNSFDVIIAPFCFLNQFSHSEVEHIIKNCLKWLRPGGKFVTDFFSPLHNPTQSFFFKGASKHKKMSIESFELYDFLKQELLEVTFVNSRGNKFLLTLPLYYYFLNEILRLFEKSGFKLKAINGGFNRESLSVSSKFFVASFLKP